uniref:FAM21/CAPZIP domain-containing protein n=1 Tax=Pyxicephalus adspersus TaxID=30357 RepID=A0AAV3B5M2_PYXAD|nr:TPA: hypothetical protein GDO54_002119 [Pyxicephalus adspersus]
MEKYEAFQLLHACYVRRESHVFSQVPPHKPTRRKPPCSLPIAKAEATNNGDEKLSPPHTQMPRIKVKSSPLIEKLQANLAFAPASLLPGPSPKSPGLKVMASPFNSPPSTPSSPGLHPHTSESEESPVSFEQPPEGTPLSSYTKVRTRGSLKRRPPSRRFRKSQTDMDFDMDIMNTTPKENGDKVKEEGPESSKGKDDTCETDAASHEPVEKSSESRQDDPGKAEKEVDKETQDKEGSPSTAERENPNKEEATSDTNDIDSPITKEEIANAEDDNEKPSDEQEKEESSKPSKSDGDDKPEK